jgi:HAD superfamily hydrolase (TIGR01509 family)
LMLAAVIFDFDGIIIDSEPLHFRALRQVAASEGLSLNWEDYLARHIGLDDRDAFRGIFRAAGRHLPASTLVDLIQQKAQVFQGLVRNGVQPYPGVVELINALSRQTAIGLCSGALRSDIDPVLRYLGLVDIFPVIVTADDVRISKPHPESYLLAVRRIAEQTPEAKISSHQCLAIEDTPSGISSARAAGLAVLGVTNNFPAHHLSAADRIVSGLAGLTYHDLSLIPPASR